MNMYEVELKNTPAFKEDLMGVVLKFPLERVSRTSSLRFEERHSSQVLMFEGVQYCSETSAEQNVASDNVADELAKPNSF